MEYQITVPNVDDFDVVEISEILVAVGDTVNADDSVVTLESEKAAMEIPSSETGVVEQIHAKVGDQVKSDTLLITLKATQDKDEAAQDRDEAVVPEQPTATQPPTEAITDQQTRVDKQKPEPKRKHSSTALRASPSVRRFARELGVQLSAVAGTGAKGRIVRADVAQYFRSLVSASAPQTSLKQVDYRQFGNTRVESIGRIPRTAAKHLQNAWQTIPHVCQHGEAEIGRLEAYRQQLNNADNRTAKLTLLPFLIKALALSLKEHPHFNASIDDSDTLLIREYYHIGFAVDTDNGLLVPVIRDADSKDIETIADEISTLAQQARDGKLTAKAMSGGCITISNLGGLDSGAFTPIINAPEAAILGISRSRITPYWDGKQFIAKHILPLHLSYDHRLNNGVSAVVFLSYYSSLLSNPKAL
ncbi:MAG: 2-oxo acid dehydrogenase subunit E2 [Chromatiales bacterium]|nr:2-oxo acid dehydrogenase subunit E2 [Chromatiales bacterium]